MVQILEVTSVTARLKFGVVSGGPGRPVRVILQLAVNARGLTRTTGWTNGRLVPRIQLPGSAMKIFDFEATPPGGASQPTVTPITAREWTGNYSTSIKQVAVYTETNKMAADITGLFTLAQAALAEHKKAPKAAKATAKKKALPKKKVKAPPKKKTPPNPRAKQKKAPK